VCWYLQDWICAKEQQKHNETGCEISRVPDATWDIINMTMEADLHEIMYVRAL
jgi:hypothetical protein